MVGSGQNRPCVRSVLSLRVLEAYESTSCVLVEMCTARRTPHRALQMGLHPFRITQFILPFFSPYRGCGGTRIFFLHWVQSVHKHFVAQKSTLLSIVADARSRLPACLLTPADATRVFSGSLSHRAETEHLNRSA